MTTQQTRPGFGQGGGEAGGEERDGLLRMALKLDAVASGATGALSLAAGAVLDDLLGTPLTLMVPVGVFLLAYAAFVWVVGSRRRINAAAAWTVVALNLLWVADSILLVLAGWFPLTGMGVAFVFAQAAAVLLLADLQFLGLRRARRAARPAAG